MKSLSGLCLGRDFFCANFAFLHYSANACLLKKYTRIKKNEDVWCILVFLFIVPFTVYGANRYVA